MAFYRKGNSNKILTLVETGPKTIFTEKFHFDGSSLSLKVIDKNNSPCIFLTRGSYFMTLSEPEIYDLFSFSNTILDSVKKCRQAIVDSGATLKYFVPPDKTDQNIIPPCEHSVGIRQKAQEEQRFQLNAKKSVKELTSRVKKSKKSKNIKLKEKDPKRLGLIASFSCSSDNDDEEKNDTDIIENV